MSQSQGRESRTTDVDTYSFNALAVHPPPERLESLTGYMIRLAEANGIRSVHAFTTLAQLYRGLSHKHADHPLLSFGDLPTAAACSREALLATTFHPLGRRFGLSPRPQSVGQFLSQALAPARRYCPLCLADHPYYPLTWRFVTLAGCAPHRCRLRDRCGRCGGMIPFLASPLKIGFCPRCGQDLRACPTEALAGDGLRQAQTHVADLEGLLSPLSPATVAPDLPRHIGREFARLRQERGLTMGETAMLLGVHRSSVSNLEYASDAIRAAPFARYVRYAAVLDVSLSAVIGHALALAQAGTGHDAAGRQLYPRRGAVRPTADQVVATLEAVLAAAEADGRGPLTLDELGRRAGIRLKPWRRHPQVKGLLDRVRQRQRRYIHDEEEVRARVVAAIRILEGRHERVTQRAVGDAVGLSVRRLTDYPGIKDVFAHIASARPDIVAREAHLREQTLLREVEQAVATLRGQGRTPTRPAVARLVGKSPATLKHYPKVRDLLDRMTAG